MKQLKFSNSEVKKIVSTISTGKAWKHNTPSIDNKFSIELRNNPSKNKIDVYTDGKYVDDYTYDLEEKDDVYAAVVNVLDYLSNIMNKYNKRHPEAIKEGKIEAYGVKGMKNTKWRKTFKSEKDMEKWIDKNDAEVQGTRDLNESSDDSFRLPHAADDLVESISKGMLRAYGKRLADADIHYTCKSCETNIPKYKGSYPTKCPSCGESIKLMKETDKDEAIWGGPFKRGEVVKVRLEDPKKFYDATLIHYNVADKTYGASINGKLMQGISTKNIK